MYVATTGIYLVQYNLDYNNLSHEQLGKNFKMEFDAAKDIYTSEYNIIIRPSEFNISNNPTCRVGSTGSYQGILNTPLTQSGWSPYFHTVGFYDENNRCVMKAKYPQNIKTRQDIPLLLKVKMDW